MLNSVAFSFLSLKDFFFSYGSWQYYWTPTLMKLLLLLWSGSSGLLLWFLLHLLILSLLTQILMVLQPSRSSSYRSTLELCPCLSLTEFTLDKLTLSYANSLFRGFLWYLFKAIFLSSSFTVNTPSSFHDIIPYRPIILLQIRINPYENKITDSQRSSKSKQP